MYVCSMHCAGMNQFSSVEPELQFVSSLYHARTDGDQISVKIFHASVHCGQPDQIFPWDPHSVNDKIQLF